MKKWLSVAASAAIVFSIVGCGSSSDGGNTTSIGTFEDAPVQGLDYNTSSGQKGYTDKQGHFKYYKGDKVEFRLGSFVLGTAIAKKTVTPYDISEYNTTKAINIAMLLQNFDGNKNDTKVLDLSKLKDYNFSSSNLKLDIAPSELKNRVSDLFNGNKFFEYINDTNKTVIGPIAAKKKMDDYLSKNPDTMVGDKVPLDNINFPLGTAQFSNGFDLNATWGIGSAATHKVGDANDTFYSMTDRGVNIKCDDSKDITGKKICDDGKIFPFPDFTPTIFKFKIVGDKAEVLNVIPLEDKNGVGITGVSNPISNFSEQAYDVNGSILAKNINGVDSEAIAALKDGTFWISEEYSPSLLHIAADGKVIERLVPDGLEDEYKDHNVTYDVKGELPAILAKRHENRGIESIAVSPDQKYLYFMMQSPLDNPDEDAYKKSQSVRLYKMEIADTSNIKEYLFVMDDPKIFATDYSVKKRKQKDVKVSDMEAIGDDKLIIDERIHTSRLYIVDLTSAKPVTEQQSENLETNTTGVTPLAKKLVFSTDPQDGYIAKNDTFPEKIEGVAHLGGSKFLLINDNDFGIEGDKTVAKVVNINLTKQEHKPLNVSIIHVNDEHSHLLADKMSLYFNGQKVKAYVGGAPRVVAKIKQLQHDENNTLTLNAGDTFQGTLYFTLFKGEADQAMLNSVKWDALELGNHEFDNGDQFLADYLDGLNLDSSKVLASNVEAPSSDPLYKKWSPYTIKTFPNGEQVGIIGIDIAQKTKVSSSPGKDIVFKDETQTAQKYINELKSKGINKIVLLSHFGLDNDLKMIPKLDGVDVVIDGDSHSLLGDFSAVGLKSAKSSYPYIAKDKESNKVCVGQAWSYNYIVGNMNVGFNADGIVQSCKGTPTLVVSDKFTDKDGNELNATMKTLVDNTINKYSNLEIVKEDSEAADKLSKFSQQVEKKAAKVIGESAEFLGLNRIPGDKEDGQSVLSKHGSDITPIVAKAFYDQVKNADAAIQNGGGVRIPIPEGNITIGEIYELLPFANTLFEIDMKGSEIKQVLEDALTNIYDNNGSTGSFPYAYGLRYDIDANKAKDNRISNLEIKDKDNGNWDSIDNDKMYTIVTNSYTAAGHDGYTTFAKVQEERGKGLDTYYDYAMSFADYVEAKTAKGEDITKLPVVDLPIQHFTPLEK